MVVDLLITELRLKDSYSRPLTVATSALNQFQATGRRVLDVSLALGKGLSALGGSLLGVAVTASKVDADFEAMGLALRALMGDTKAANDEFVRLLDIARLPGINETGAVKTSVALQSAGMNARMAERSMIAMANAVALSGRGADELNSVVLAITQIASKGYVSAEEINQIAEHLPGIRTMMNDAFGTSNAELLSKNVGAAEFIEGIVAQMEKMPRVSGGAKNAWENLFGIVKRGYADLGKGVNTIFQPMVTVVDDFSRYLLDSGVLATLGKSVASIFEVDENSLINVLSYIIATAEQIPVIVSAVFEVTKSLFNRLLDVAKFIFPMIRALGSLSPFGDSPFEAIESVVGAIGMRAEQIKSDYAKNKNRPIDALTDTSEGAWDKKPPRVIKDIATNTLRTAQAIEKSLDIESTLYGGGAVSRRQFSTAKVFGGDKIAKAVDLIREAIQDSMSEQLAYGGRYG